MKSLYEISLECLTECDEDLPEDVYFDARKTLFWKKNKRISAEAFARLLNARGRRMEVHRMFSSCLDVKGALAAYGQETRNRRVGEFLLEAGWHREAESVMKACVDGTCDRRLLFNYYTTLLRIYTADLNFVCADEAFKKAVEVGRGMNLGVVNSLRGRLLYAQGWFTEAHRVCSLAMKELLNEGPMQDMPAFVSAVKTMSLISREKWATTLIENAVHITRERGEDYRLAYSEILEDYATVLHRDKAEDSATRALMIVCRLREDTLGLHNLRTISANVNLLSVDSYAKGDYFEAHALYEHLVDILRRILPVNCGQHLSGMRATEVSLLKGMLGQMQTAMEELVETL